ncbi:hypothetical protein [Roseateles chitinivorans]|uniref:hypothetical protein n=1 Tax=Roseateles chitinivorans TaxID=2917965 RepID=UPI003D672E84
MTTSLNPYDPDIESVARAFADRAAAAPDEALSQWRADTVSLSPVQRATGARLAASQLSWRAKAALGGSSSGTALLADWDSDRMRAPYVPQLPCSPPARPMPTAQASSCNAAPRPRSTRSSRVA